jgi:hypothetical protein
MSRTTLGTKLSIVFVGAALSLGGLGAAAYAGALPAGIQSVAHTLIAAPVAQHPKPHEQQPIHHDPSAMPATGKGHAQGPKKTVPVGPDASGPAAFGLCNAYANMKRHGNAIGHSIAMRNLAAAAGGASQIDAYCAKVARSHPSESPEREGTGEAKPGTPKSHGPKMHGPKMHGPQAHGRKSAHGTNAPPKPKPTH